MKLHLSISEYTKFSVIAVAPRPDVVVVGDAERLRVARAARHVDHAVRR